MLPETAAPRVRPVSRLGGIPDDATHGGRGPGRHRLWAVPIGVVALLLPRLPAAVGAPLDETARTLSAVLGTSLPVLALAAGGLLCCHWWLTDHQGSARVAAALLGLGLATLPSRFVAAEPGSPVWGPTPTLSDVAGTGALGVILLLVLFRVEFQHRVQPVVVGVVVGVSVGTLTALAAAGALGSWAHEPAPAPWSGVLVGLLIGVGVVALVGRASDLPAPTSRELQVAAAALTLAWWVLHDGGAGVVEVLAVVVALAAMVLVVTTAASLLVRGLHETARAGRSLADRATSAEGRVREDEELLHEVRSTVAGINATSRILHQPDHEVTAVHQERLQYLLVHEIDRLNRMVSHHGELAQQVDVDAVVNPLVSSFRYLGVTVDWRPGRATAYARPTAVAELVQILLTNASKHAAGSQVRLATRVRDGVAEIEVTDRGPGVPPAQRDRIFQRGAKGAASRGHGLGLYIARRLAAQQGGSLTLDPRVTDGASFLVHLPVTGGGR